MKAMKDYRDVFTAKNTHYSVLQGGTHDDACIRRYLYNALQNFFR